MLVKTGKPSNNHPCRDISVCVNSNTCPTFITLSENMGFSLKNNENLQLNITSLQTSHNQLKFYQEQNDYDIIALQEKKMSKTS